MKISRYGIVERPNNLPHISGAVVHGDKSYELLEDLPLDRRAHTQSEQPQFSSEFLRVNFNGKKRVRNLILTA